MISNTRAAAKALFKVMLSSLVKAKADNSPDFDAVVDAVAEDFANRVEAANNLTDVQKEIILKDEVALKEARDFYSGVPEKFKKLRKRLVEYREAMNMNLKYGSHKKACKYLVIQAESLCHELAHPDRGNIIVWLEKRDSSIKPDTDSAGNKYLGTRKLLLAVDLRYDCQASPGSLSDIKKLRDYESHGLPQEKIDEMDALLSNAISRWSEHQGYWDDFLEKLISALYNY